MADSTHTIVSKLNAGLNLSVLNTSNWQGSGFVSFSYSSDIEFDFIKTTPHSKHIYDLTVELGFTRIMDSIWQKHADHVGSQYIFKTGTKKWSQTATIILSAKMLNSYDYAFNTGSGTTGKSRTGSFFSPSVLEIGYGCGFTFFQHSIVNVSLASARLRVIHDSSSDVSNNSIPVAGLQNSKVYFDYGFSLQYILTIAIIRQMEFNSNGKMFLKDFNRDNIETELSGSCLFKVTKYLRLRADFKIMYAPAVSYKLQFRNEFLIGFFYEMSK